MKVASTKTGPIFGFTSVQREVSTIRAAASAALAPVPAKDALQRPQALPYRVGHGFDLHRLEEGPYKLILGGLEIPHDRGCVAHSDGEMTASQSSYFRLG